MKSKFKIALLFIFFITSISFSTLLVYGIINGSKLSVNNIVDFKSEEVDIDFTVEYHILNSSGSESGVIDYKPGMTINFNQDDIISINHNGVEKQYVGFSVRVKFELGENNNAEDVRYTFMDIDMDDTIEIYKGSIGKINENYTISNQTLDNPLSTTYFLHSMFDLTSDEENPTLLRLIVLKEILAYEEFNNLNASFTIKATKEK